MDYLRRVFFVKLLLIMCFLSISSCKNDQEYLRNSQPKAAQQKQVFTTHEETIVDNYHWLKDSNFPTIKDKKVLEQIKQEQKLYGKATKQIKSLKKEINKELWSMIKTKDQSVPQKLKDYWYFTKRDKGDEFSTNFRYKDDIKKAVAIDNPNKRAKHSKYFAPMGSYISYDQQMAALCFDQTGDESTHVIIKNWDENKVIEEGMVIDGPTNIVWTRDNLGFYYINSFNKQRFKAIYYHVLGNPQVKDQLIYQVPEGNDNSVGISSSADYKYVIISEGNFSTSTERYASRETVMSAQNFTVFPSDPKAKISTEISEGEAFALEFKLSEQPRILYKKLTDTEWNEWKPARPTIEYQGLDVYKNFLVMKYREFGLEYIEVRERDFSHIADIKFEDEVYALSLGGGDYEGMTFRYTYSSPRIITKQYEYSVTERTAKMIKDGAEGLNFNADGYEVKRLKLKARDGEMVYASLVYHKEKFNREDLLAYSYGAYGVNIAEGFSLTSIPYLNRGFGYLIIHPRGSSYLGQKWYHDGRLLSKKNTFYDVEDVIRGVIAEGFAKEGRVVLSGGSAGGLMVGAVVNNAPTLFRAAVSKVGFLDILTTLLEGNGTGITAYQFKEFGNPKTKEYFDYIHSYSPFHNINAVSYPHFLLTTGLKDPRVGYWETLKFAAQMRATATNNPLVLVKVNSESGHFGKSGLKPVIAEQAEEIAVILKLLQDD